MGAFSFEKACALFVNRYTMEHVPSWARQKTQEGKFYAPQYRSDREWYDNTVFPGDIRTDFTAPPKGASYCESRNQTWPLGMWLDAPYRP